MLFEAFFMAENRHPEGTPMTVPEMQERIADIQLDLKHLGLVSSEEVEELITSAALPQANALLDTLFRIEGMLKAAER